MKTMKKILAIVLALAVVLTFSVTAFADDTNAAGPGSITINNASKGVTYTLYKIFDAQIDPNNPDAVMYKAPTGFTSNDYFTVDANGFVTATEAAKDNGYLSAAAVTSLASFAVAANQIGDPIEADGDAVQFTGLDYGYYYIKSDMGEAVAIDTVNKDVVMNEKNTTTPEWHPEGPGPIGKTIVSGNSVVETKDFNIGDTVTFQIKIDTSNFVGEKGEDQITSYLIGDTFPTGLQFVSIKSVKVDDTDITDSVAYTGTKAFPIKVNWVANNGVAPTNTYYTSLYDNGAVLTVTYTAKVLDNAVIDGAGNVNTASFNYRLWKPGTEDTPDTPDTPEDPSKGEGDTKTDTAIVETYALAIQKVDPQGNELTGAEFTLPFYVKPVTGTAGEYIYCASTDTGATQVVTSGTDTYNDILIKGVAAGTYTIAETKAPTGYNPIAELEVTATKTGETTTTVTTYLDENGNVTSTKTDTKVTYTNENLAASVNVVVNVAGQALPSTGGMGTTMLLTFGALFFMGAAIVLVTKKRMYNRG